MVTLNERARGLNASHERVILVEVQATGLEAIIAIHSTARGPAFGGCRMRPYTSRAAALRDARRLSQAISRQSAMADWPFGGGKCVVIGDPASQKSDALLLALGKATHQLGSSYLTADDSGTTVRDMEIMCNVTPHARGLALASGEAGPAAAYGTFLALRVAVEHPLGRVGLTGMSVSVQGLGNLGMRLCAYLHEAGAKLIVADPQTERLAMAVRDFGARVVPVDRNLSTLADVLSPNAFGDVICDATVPRIRAGIVVGGANNQLRTARHGVALHNRGILYVPDYIANVGGVIDIAMEGPGYAPAQALEACMGITRTTALLLQNAQRAGIAPSRQVDQLAAERMTPHADEMRMLEMVA